MKVAINGFGRIGRQVYKILSEKYPDVEVVAVNDLTDTKTLAHLLKYDSNYGVWDAKITPEVGKIAVNNNEFKVLAEMDAAKLPWKELGVEVVVECTGHYTDGERAKAHLTA